MKFSLIIVSLFLSVSALASTTPSFCDSENRVYVKQRISPTIISEQVFRKNIDFFAFFGDEAASCLRQDRITDAKTQKTYTSYSTFSDDCDGGNVFGLIISDTTLEKVADINDGEIQCL